VAADQATDGNRSPAEDTRGTAPSSSTGPSAEPNTKEVLGALDTPTPWFL
jgi:hypothetical protein